VPIGDRATIDQFTTACRSNIAALSTPGLDRLGVLRRTQLLIEQAEPMSARVAELAGDDR
jgi:hypothetical protein